MYELRLWANVGGESKTQFSMIFLLCWIQATEPWTALSKSGYSPFTTRKLSLERLMPYSILLSWLWRAGKLFNPQPSLLSHIRPKVFRMRSHRLTAPGGQFKGHTHKGPRTHTTSRHYTCSMGQGTHCGSASSPGSLLSGL